MARIVLLFSCSLPGIDSSDEGSNVAETGIGATMATAVYELKYVLHMFDARTSS
jgi:hypothetical protein